MSPPYGDNNLVASKFEAPETQKESALSKSTGLTSSDANASIHAMQHKQRETASTHLPDLSLASNAASPPSQKDFEPPAKQGVSKKENEADSKQPKHVTEEKVAGKSDNKAATKKQADDTTSGLPGFHLDGPVVPGQTTHGTIDVDGKQREAWIHLPKGFDPKKPTPLMVVLNGTGPAGATTETFTSMSPRADKDNFIAVYLQGESVQHGYNNGQWPFKNGNDDVKYVKNVIDTLEKDKNQVTIDKSRVGLMGFAVGGSEAYLAGQQLPVSSVITVEGYEGKGGKWDESPQKGTSLLSFRGQDDRVVRPGGTPQMVAETEAKKAEVSAIASMPGQNVLSAMLMVDVASALDHKKHGDAPLSLTAVEAWAEKKQLEGTYVQPEQHTVDRYVKANQINQPPEVTHHGNITIKKYSNQSTGAAVEQVDIEHGQLALNGSSDHSNDLKLIGTPTNDVSTPDMAADFFINHPRKDLH